MKAREIAILVLLITALVGTGLAMLEADVWLTKHWPTYRDPL